jgi:hypothetical protein
MRRFSAVAARRARRPTAALRLLRELRSGDALASRIDPALPVIVPTTDDAEWASPRALEVGAQHCVQPRLATSNSWPRARGIAARGARSQACRAGSVRWRSICTGRRATSPAGASTWLATSACCSRIWPPSRSACSPSASCCASLGLPHRGHDQDARRARLPAAQEARAGRRCRLRGQPARRRLPARRAGPGG